VPVILSFPFIKLNLHLFREGKKRRERKRGCSRGGEGNAANFQDSAVSSNEIFDRGKESGKRRRTVGRAGFQKP